MFKHRLTRLAALTILLIGFTSTPGDAQITSVVPNAYENAPGTGVFFSPLQTTARSYQLLIHENQLTSLVGLQLTGVTWRLPASATDPWPASAVTFQDFDLYLSGSVDPADRSFTFSENVVGPQTQVRSGALVIPDGSFSAGGSPNSFGFQINFDPYTYTGGNLLLEMRHTGHDGGNSRSVDALTTSTEGYASDFSALWTGSYDGLTGVQGNFSVVRFTAIPEPGSATIVGLAALAFIYSFNRRRRLISG